MMKDFAKAYNGLNDAQKQAVDTIDGPVIVIAGPGTGKTQLLSMRVANILKKTDVDPDNILCLTFTEAAAENMRRRIHQLIGASANGVQIYTFHGFGANILQKYPEYFYDNPAVQHLDDLGEYQLLESLLAKLPHTNPLSKKVGDSFLHLSTVRRTISWFKQAGLTYKELGSEYAKSKQFFSDINKQLDKAFSKPTSSKNINPYQELLSQMEKLSKNSQNQTALASLEELKRAIGEINAKSRYAKSITSWRNHWLVQFRQGRWRYADQTRFEFLANITNLYKDYQNYLSKHGLFTFDDMILRAYRAVHDNEELRLTLQEKYQYILVDEYQDTNGAQEKLLNELANNPINENRPNLMVVGDDDQAIYRFQGAKNSIVIDFINRWRSPEVIVLSKSYRVGQNLLNLSRNIVSQADDGLEKAIPNLKKEITSSKNSEIVRLISKNEDENYINTAKEITDLIKRGQKPSSIVVISPKHKYLEALVPYLLSNNLPINYERREQILQQPRIVEILDLVEMLTAVSKGRLQLAENSLSRILGADYWQIPAREWWEIAINAQKEHRGWLRTLNESKNSDLKRFSEAIKILGKEALNQPFSLTMAQILGNKSIKLSDGTLWSLPWRDYYFSKATIEADPTNYLKFIGQFDSLNSAFSEWSPQETKNPTLEDFYKFISLYRKSGLSMLDTSPYATSDDAITLTTVYKAKGLEWDNVFILNAQEDVWGPKTRAKNLTFRLPVSLSWIEPGQNDDSDLMRLLYVGLTRTRRKLYLTSFEFKNNGKDALLLEWLEQAEGIDKARTITPRVSKSVFIESYEGSRRALYTQPTKDLNHLLKPVMGAYRLSATHLNDFLAIDLGGPQNFLYRHLLKVPEVINTNAMYGDAIHKSLEHMHSLHSSSGVLPRVSAVTSYFSDKLRTYPLSEDEYNLLNQKGRDSLTAWFKQSKGTLSVEDISEHNFFSENIQLDGVRLTGKIDLIKRVKDSSINLIDYKTSRSLSGWSSKNQLDNLRAYSYRRQLMFYKLLVDNSNLAKKFTVNEGILEFLSADEDGKYTSLALSYSADEQNRLIELIRIVWEKIMNLDLPKVDDYPATLSGVKSFEDDLLSHKI